MPLVPPGRDPVATQFWVVYYTSGTISGSRGGAPGTAKAGYRIIRAASGQAAKDIAQNNGFNPVSFTGPYSSNAAALLAATTAKKTNVQADGGVQPQIKLPNFLGLLTNRDVLMRIGEGVLGVLLIVVGVAKLADGTALGTALKKVPIVP